MHGTVGSVEMDAVVKEESQVEEQKMGGNDDQLKDVPNDCLLSKNY